MSVGRGSLFATPASRGWCHSRPEHHKVLHDQPAFIRPSYLHSSFSSDYRLPSEEITVFQSQSYDSFRSRFPPFGPSRCPEFHVRRVLLSGMTTVGEPSEKSSAFTGKIQLVSNECRARINQLLGLDCAESSESYIEAFASSSSPATPITQNVFKTLQYTAQKTTPFRHAWNSYLCMIGVPVRQCSTSSYTR
jgi:hypothetical protein